MGAGGKVGTQTSPAVVGPKPNWTFACQHYEEDATKKLDATHSIGHSTSFGESKKREILENVPR